MKVYPNTNPDRVFPLPNPDRIFPLPETEYLTLHPGLAKVAELGEVVYPFAECYLDPDDDLSTLEWKAAGGSYVALSGAYPSKLVEAKFIRFVAADFDNALNYFLKATTTAGLVREAHVSIVTRVDAGTNKIGSVGQNIRVFADARFARAKSSHGVTAVSYAIDGGVKTAIPASFGTDLADRVRDFYLSWVSAGTHVLTLYVEDADSVESFDHVSVQVGG